MAINATKETQLHRSEEQNLNSPNFSPQFLYFIQNLRTIIGELIPTSEPYKNVLRRTFKEEIIRVKQDSTLNKNSSKITSEPDLLLSEKIFQLVHKGTTETKESDLEILHFNIISATLFYLIDQLVTFQQTYVQELAIDIIDDEGNFIFNSTLAYENACKIIQIINTAGVGYCQAQLRFMDITTSAFSKKTLAPLDQSNYRVGIKFN